MKFGYKKIWIQRNFGGKRTAPPPPPVKRHKIKIDVEHEDICYRVEDNFGLFQTQSKLAIMVRVDTRG